LAISCPTTIIDLARSYPKLSFVGIGVAKALSVVIILSCGKDSDDLLMSINIVVSLAFNHLFKTFNLITEDRLYVFECQVFPDLCYGLRSSETIRPLYCARIFRRAGGCKCSDRANQINREGIHALHRSFIQSLCNHWNCPSQWQVIQIISMAKSPLLVEKISWNTSSEIFLAVF
jgi:hypothetical protein